VTEDGRVLGIVAMSSSLRFLALGLGLLLALSLSLVGCAGEATDEGDDGAEAVAVKPATEGVSARDLPKLKANDGKKPMEITPTYTSAR
jgi:hypothetical protein